MYCKTCPWCIIVYSDKQMLSRIMFCYTSTRHVLQYTVFGEDKRLRKCTLSVPRPDSIIPYKLYFTKCIAFGHKLNTLSRQRLARLVTVQTLGCVRSHGSTWVPVAESMSNQQLKNKSCLEGEHEALICKILNHPQENRIGLNYVNGFQRTCTWFLFALSERLSWITLDFWCFVSFDESENGTIQGSFEQEKPYHKAAEGIPNR